VLAIRSSSTSPRSCPCRHSPDLARGCSARPAPLAAHACRLRAFRRSITKSSCFFLPSKPEQPASESFSSARRQSASRGRSCPPTGPERCGSYLIFRLYGTVVVRGRVSEARPASRCTGFVRGATTVIHRKPITRAAPYFEGIETRSGLGIRMGTLGTRPRTEVDRVGSRRIRIRNIANVLACFCHCRFHYRKQAPNRAPAEGWELRAAIASKHRKLGLFCPSRLSPQSRDASGAGARWHVNCSISQVRAPDLKQRRPRLDCGDRTSRTTGTDSPTDAHRCSITGDAFTTPDLDGG
jgi:hypothetical protein